MVTITVTCYAWALSSGDHLFTCGAISRRPQWVWALWHQTGAQYSAVECTRARVAIRRIVAPAPQQVASGARRVMSASCEVRPLIDLWAPVMESQDPFLRVSEVSGLVSVLRLWILQRDGLLKFLIQRVFLLYLLVRNNHNMSKKCQKFEKIQVRSDDDIFLKRFGKMHKFWSLECRSRTSSLESRSRNFNQVSEVTVEHPRQDPFQRPPLLYKDPYSSHHIHYGNKDVLYISKVYYMNKIHTKLPQSLPNICEIETNRRKNINPSTAAVNLK